MIHCLLENSAPGFIVKFLTASNSYYLETYFYKFAIPYCLRNVFKMSEYNTGAVALVCTEPKPAAEH